ncbi:LOW QUALITY PROTEIN: hypothetical protein CRUP_025099 [Coryphaenoides rupestris]|nr:LOW QUALITY PROTEIN: hypothetical protein CRUP_025099 [Coryphaenoides rupestris]
MVILADHLEVPSSTACLAIFRWLMKSSLVTWNMSWMTSNTSGQFFSRIFMRSFMAMMMFCVLSSAPCLELFSTAPAVGVEQFLALLVAFDAALGAAHALPRDAPEQTLALMAVGAVAVHTSKLCGVVEEMG